MSVLIKSAGCWPSGRRERAVVATEAPPMVNLRTMASPMPLVPPGHQDPFALEFVPVNGKRAGGCHYPISSEVILPLASANV
jgi:hypothetical protein